MARLEEAWTALGAPVRVVVEDHAEGLLDAVVDRVRDVIGDVTATLDVSDPSSGLRALNAHRRSAVAVSPVVARFVEAVQWAGERTRGLVDATVLPAVQRLGDPTSAVPWNEALAEAPTRRPGAPDPLSRWRHVHLRGALANRPRGVKLDPGAFAKGIGADLAVAAAAPHAARVLVTWGGATAAAGESQHIPVRNPLTFAASHEVLASGGVGTTALRPWRTGEGRVVHGLVDPSTGEPAWTGLAAATALGASALEASVLATAAMLAGPLGARRLLRDRGGLLVDERGGVTVVRPDGLGWRGDIRAVPEAHETPRGLWPVA